MPAQSAVDHSIVYDAHEERLQRLEDKTSGIVTEVALLRNSVETGINDLGNKFTEFAEPVGAALKLVEDHGAYIKGLRAAEVARAELKLARKKFWKNALITVVVGTLGVLAKEAGKWLWGVVF
jgi:hypothetical protein